MSDTELPHSLPPEDLEIAEARVRDRLGAELEPFQHFVLHLVNLLPELVEALLETQRFSAKIRALIVARLAADLRVCEWAAMNGYSLQAMTVAAAIHEIAWGLMYVGDSDDRAEQWASHNNQRKQYPQHGHVNVVEQVGKAIGMLPDKITTEQQIYWNLCMAKHGNPILHRNYGYEDTGETTRIHWLPYYSSETVRQARFALLQAGRSAWFCIWHMGRELTGVHSRRGITVYERVRELAEARDALYDTYTAADLPD